MEYETVAQREASSCGNEIVADMRLILEILVVVLTKGISAEKTVVAGHPPRGMAQVFWMIENRDTIDLALSRRIVIAPVRPFAPRGAIDCSGARDDMAL